MPDTKTSALAAFTTVHSDDLLYGVDVHDTTMATSGTSKKLTTAAILAALSGATTFGGAVSVSIPNGGTGAATAQAAFDALSPVSALGDIIYRDASHNVRLAGNTAAIKKFLRQTGNGSASAAPAWDTIAAGDVPSTGLTVTQHAAVITVDTPSAGAVTCDCSVSDRHSVTMAVSTEITLSNPPSGKAQSILLYLIQAGSGSCVPTFSPTVDWGTAGTPTWSTAVGKVDKVVLDWNGSAWTGAPFGLGF